jgi:acetyl esterase/lipase
LLAALTLGGCSPAEVLNYVAAREGIAVTQAVAYGEGPRRTLDVYRPAAMPTAGPVVVFFYGGSWQAGDKAIYRFVGTALARRGYLTLVPDYRVYPQTRYPGFLEDAAQAVRWAKQNAARYGGDPSRLFVMGHSAGAYIAAMLALDPRWLRSADLDPGRDLAGLIGIAGPYDFLPLQSEPLITIFGGAARTETQPIAHVGKGAPPALLVTGAWDRLVDPGNTTRLAAKLRAAGNRVRSAVYPRIGHMAIIGAFAAPLRFLAPVLRDADAFMKNPGGGAPASTGAAS